MTESENQLLISMRDFLKMRVTHIQNEIDGLSRHGAKSLIQTAGASTYQFSMILLGVVPPETNNFTDYAITLLPTSYYAVIPTVKERLSRAVGLGDSDDLSGRSDVQTTNESQTAGIETQAGG